MNARLARRTRRWLRCATAGLVVAGPAFLAGEDLKAQAPGLLNPPPNPVPISARGERAAPVRQTAGETSEVVKHLEALYARDGREMPPMKLSELPNTQYAAEFVEPPPEPAENVSPPMRPVEKPNLFGRLFGFWRNRSSAAQPTDAARQPKPARMPSPAVPQSPSYFPPRGAAPPPQVATGRTAGRPASAAPAPTATAMPPAVNPFDDLSGSTPRPSQERTVGSKDAAPEVAAGTALENFPEPFTEVSEEDADRQAGPYTGLKLVDESTALPSISPSLPASPAGEHTADSEAYESPIAGAGEPAGFREMDGGAATVADQSSPADGPGAKLRMIQARGDLIGLKGFCPVVLRDERDLRDARSEFTVVHRGVMYQFSSAEAMEKFEADPEKYAPIQAGTDVVRLVAESQQVAGSIEHAVWFRDRLYLFSSSESLDRFRNDPARYAQAR